MEIIPVIDLLGGQVVRAQRGDRNNYLPIRSTLCDSSAPLEVARALLGLYPFRSLYIADLDAIQGLGDHLAIVRALQQHFPAVEFWLDCGIRYPEQLIRLQQLGLRCVIGSERLQSMNQCRQLTDIADDALLSLDFGRHGFIGPHELLDNPACWTSHLLCMTLARVGSHEGPDMATLAAIQRMAGTRKVYAAGGIRGASDLAELAQAGIAGALIASALHDGLLDRDTLSAFAQ